MRLPRRMPTTSPVNAAYAPTSHRLAATLSRPLGCGVASGRVSEALGELDLADESDLTTVVVTHVSPIKAAVCWALGVDDLVSWRLWVATASITSIAIGGGRV